MKLSPIAIILLFQAIVIACGQAPLNDTTTKPKRNSQLQKPKNSQNAILLEGCLQTLEEINKILAEAKHDPTSFIHGAIKREYLHFKEPLEHKNSQSDF